MSKIILHLENHKKGSKQKQDVLQQLLFQLSVIFIPTFWWFFFFSTPQQDSSRNRQTMISLVQFHEAEVDRCYAEPPAARHMQGQLMYSHTSTENLSNMALIQQST